MNLFLYEKFQQYFFIKNKCNDEKITQISKYLNQCIAEKNTKQCEKYFEYLKKCNELIEIFKK